MRKLAYSMGDYIPGEFKVKVLDGDRKPLKNYPVIVGLDRVSKGIYVPHK
jgi:hypothetical protein